MHFLVVDDEPRLREVLAAALARSYSADVATAEDTETGLRAAESRRVDLITTDLNRPGQSGHVFVEKLQGTPLLRRVPIIVISGNYDDAQELALYRGGARAVVRKPFPFGTLIEVVDRILDMRRDPDEALLDLGYESASLDYKERLMLDTKDARASVAKDVIAFANSGGGTIVVGVAEPFPGEFVPRGLTQKELAELESSRVARAIRDYITPMPLIGVRKFRSGPRTFVRINISATKALILAKKQNDAAGLHPGRIYVRSGAAESVELREPDQVRALLHRLNE